MVVSKHAEDRIRERCGFNKKAMDRMAQKAWKEGIQHSQTKGRLNKWLTSVYFREERASCIKICGDKVYIFCEEVLVTVIPVPANLMKDLKKMVKNK